MGNPIERKKKIAIIGSGVSGLSAAWLLGQDKNKFEIHLYEADDYVGGHTHTVDISSIKDPKQKIGVDTGFIVCNPVTYPNFLRFLDLIGVETRKSDMSFAVSRNEGEFEWAGDNLNSVFTQRKNLIPLGNGFKLYKMLYEIVRFHEQAHDLAEQIDLLQFDDEGKLKSNSTDVMDSSSSSPLFKMTLAQFFKENQYSSFFYENYVLPMTASIWSTPADMTFDKFPLLTLVRFMRNHVMLQIGGRPKWRTVDGGSRNYVAKVLEKVDHVYLNTPVVSIKRRKRDQFHDSQLNVTVIDGQGNQNEFDHVIMATHTDQALRILGEDATLKEREILGMIKYVKNRAVLHRDETLMPKNKRAWSSWNYLTVNPQEMKSESMCLTYWMNRLQIFIDPEKYGQVFVTMNPLKEPQEETIMGEWEYEHPLYAPETIYAQDRLNEIQNKEFISFCGAWSNYGFHEDGFTSGLLAALSIGASCPFSVCLNGGYPTHRQCPDPPQWAVEAWGVQRYNPSPPIYVPWKASSKKLQEQATRGIRMRDVLSRMGYFVVGVAIMITGIQLIYN